MRWKKLAPTLILYLVVAALVVWFCAGCAAAGAVAGGGVAGAAIGGLPGAAAGAAGGLIGSFWTEIVHWWSDLWDGIDGATPTAQQVSSASDTITIVKWVIIAAVGWTVLKLILGPRYRELTIEFLQNCGAALRSFLTLKFKSGVQSMKDAKDSALQAGGLKHSR